jgi:hypothetical protein
VILGTDGDDDVVVVGLAGTCEASYCYLLVMCSPKVLERVPDDIDDD